MMNFFSKKKNSKINDEQELLNPAIALQYVLERICGFSAQLNGIIENDSVIFPEYQIKITPNVKSISENVAFLHFWCYSPDWENPLLDYNMASHSFIKGNLQNAVANFMNGFMTAFIHMKQKINPIPLQATYREQGYQLLKEKLVQAITAYMDLYNQGHRDYDEIYVALKSALQDATLAYECLYFLPEICAQCAYSEQIQMPDHLFFMLPDGSSRKVYTSQISDFRRLEKAILEVFDAGVFGDYTEDIYNIFINHSSIEHTMRATMNNPSPISQMAIAFPYEEEYVFR